MSAATGALVAVCGLAANAGTTLLAWLLAQELLRGEASPVLLAELPVAAGGLVALTGLAAGRSLTRLAVEPAQTRAWPEPEGAPAGLRVAADVEGLEAAVDPELLLGTLDAACAEHACVVVDCGRLHEAVRPVLDRATHVVWTVPAGPSAGETARTLLFESDLAPPPGDARELLAVVATRPSALPPRASRALREVTAERAQRLVLVPHERRLAGAPLDESSSRRLAASVAALAGPLRREHVP